MCFQSPWRALHMRCLLFCFNWNDICSSLAFFTLTSLSLWYVFNMSAHKYCGSSQVLHLLANLGNDENVDKSINAKLVRSQSMEYELLKPPRRTFLNCSNNHQSNDKTTATNDKKRRQIIVYNLPSSVAEYVSSHCQEEVAYVKSQIYHSQLTHGGADRRRIIIITYNPNTDSFLGISEQNTDENDIDYARRRAAYCGDERGNGSNCHIMTSSSSSSSSETLAALIELERSVMTELMIHPTSSSSSRKDVVVVVGNGGREHAIAVSLAKSPYISEVICYPGNGGTMAEGGKIRNAESAIITSPLLLLMNNESIIEYVKKVNPNMVVIGPEQPLVHGIVDELQFQCPNVRVFGPSKAGAQLEASKAHAKDFLRECNIPTAKYRNFTCPREAVAYVTSLDITNDRQVIKASGLAAGKGVLLPITPDETIAAIHEIMSDKSFGSAGDTCVIESYMTGPEASCLAFCDGKTAKLMPAAQDHKRALDGDLGLNTGGMGAYAPAPCVTPELHREIERMCITTVEKMAERGTPYVGILYAGMM